MTFYNRIGGRSRRDHIVQSMTAAFWTESHSEIRLTIKRAILRGRDSSGCSARKREEKCHARHRDVYRE